MSSSGSPLNDNETLPADLLAAARSIDTFVLNFQRELQTFAGPFSLSTNPSSGAPLSPADGVSHPPTLSRRKSTARLTKDAEMGLLGSTLPGNDSATTLTGCDTWELILTAALLEEQVAAAADAAENPMSLSRWAIDFDGLLHNLATTDPVEGVEEREGKPAPMRNITAALHAALLEGSKVVTAQAAAAPMATLSTSVVGGEDAAADTTVGSAWRHAVQHAVDESLRWMLGWPRTKSSQNDSTCYFAIDASVSTHDSLRIRPVSHDDPLTHLLAERSDATWSQTAKRVNRATQTPGLAETMVSVLPFQLPVASLQHDLLSKYPMTSTTVVTGSCCALADEAQLRTAVEGCEWLGDMVRSAGLPFRTKQSVPTLLEGGRTILMRELSNEERLERLIACHGGSSDYPRRVQTASVDSSVVPEVALLPEDERACPEAVELMQRFLLTDRMPQDFRGGIAPANSKFYHEEDPLQAAFPCVFLPTKPLNSETAAMAEHDADQHDRLHHAWLLVCRRAVFLLVDMSESQQETLRGAQSIPHFGTMPLAEKLRALQKARAKRRKAFEGICEQAQHDCLLMCVLEWRYQDLMVDFSQNSNAFVNRCVNAAAAAPPILGGMTPPRLDRMMQLYYPHPCRVDPLEMSQQRSRSMVLHVSRMRDRNTSELLKYSVVFPTETITCSASTFFWAALHPSRFSISTKFSPVRSTSEMNDLPQCSGLPSPSDTSVRETAGPAQTIKSSKNRVPLLPNGSSVPHLLRAADPTLFFFAGGPGSGPAARREALSSGSPLMRMSEPLGMERTSPTSDWFPFQHLGLDENCCLPVCRSLHVHPMTLLGLQTKLMLHPNVRWVSLWDIALPLLGASHSASMINAFVAERIAEHFVEMGLICPVDVLQRVTAQ